MGIDIKHPVKALTDETFRRLDYQVMAMAFDLYNEIGNLWDENDYREQLHDRCLSKGLTAETEVLVSVAHKEFRKSYFIDLQLYKVAILLFMGIPNDQINKRFCPLSPDSLFHITGLSRRKDLYQKKLRKYLQASSCRHIDRINFDQNQIELRTLSKKLLCH